MPDHILPCLPVGVGGRGFIWCGGKFLVLPVSHCPTPRFSRCDFSLSTTRPKVRKKACLTTYYPAYPWVWGRGFVWCGGIFLVLPVSQCPTPRFSRCGFSLSTTRPKVRKKVCLTTYYPSYPWVWGDGFIMIGGYPKNHRCSSKFSSRDAAS